MPQTKLLVSFSTQRFIVLKKIVLLNKCPIYSFGKIIGAWSTLSDSAGAGCCCWAGSATRGAGLALAGRSRTDMPQGNGRLRERVTMEWDPFRGSSRSPSNSRGLFRSGFEKAFHSSRRVLRCFDNYSTTLSFWEAILSFRLLREIRKGVLLTMADKWFSESGEPTPKYDTENQGGLKLNKAFK